MQLELKRSSNVVYIELLFVGTQETKLVAL